MFLIEIDLKLGRNITMKNINRIKWSRPPQKNTKEVILLQNIINQMNKEGIVQSHQMKITKIGEALTYIESKKVDM